jgi:DNA-directed RNA polymerase
VAAVTVARLQSILSGSGGLQEIADGWLAKENQRRSGAKQEPLGAGAAIPWVKSMAQTWLTYGVNRKLIKRNVMTLPYGATLFSHTSFIEEMLAANERVGTPAPWRDRDDRKRACGFLAKLVWDAIGEVVVSAVQVMAWLRECARSTAKEGLPMVWTSPAGLPIMQAYHDQSSRFVYLKLGDKFPRRKMTFLEDQDTLDSARQASGAAPNWVHTLDAALLQRVIVAGGVKGIQDFAVVHDAYGTHCSQTETLHRTVVTEFVRMYEEHDVLQEFADSMRAMSPRVSIPDPPRVGTLDIRETLASDYLLS